MSAVSMPQSAATMEFEYSYELKKAANVWHRSFTRKRQLSKAAALRIARNAAKTEGCTLGRVVLRITGEQVLKP